MSGGGTFGYAWSHDEDAGPLVDRLRMEGAEEVVVEQLQPRGRPIRQIELQALLDRMASGNVLSVRCFWTLAPHPAALHRALVAIEKAGVHLVSLDDGVDGRTDIGRAVLKTVRGFTALATDPPQPEAVHEGSTRAGRPRALTDVQRMALLQARLDDPEHSVSEILRLLGMPRHLETSAHRAIREAGLQRPPGRRRRADQVVNDPVQEHPGQGEDGS